MNADKFRIVPMVIIDYRVYTFSIESYFKTIAANHNKETQATWLKCAWAIAINRGFTGLPYVPHTIAVVDDSNPYWRTKYLEVSIY